MKLQNVLSVVVDKKESGQFPPCNIKTIVLKNDIEGISDDILGQIINGPMRVPFNDVSATRLGDFSVMFSGIEDVPFSQERLDAIFAKIEKIAIDAGIAEQQIGQNYQGRDMIKSGSADAYLRIRTFQDEQTAKA